MHNQIPPHGGELVNRVLTGDKRSFWLEKAQSLPSIVVDSLILSDIELIAIGAMSPLEGFMCRNDYNHVVEHNRLSSGLPWTLPIVLGVSPDEADNLDAGSHVTLKDEKDNIVAILHLQEKYTINKEREAAFIYKTKEIAHPGVAYLMEKRGDVLLGGDIDVINLPICDNFNEYRLRPSETRHAFEQKGWKRVVAFHTNNPIHRADEYIQKCALEICDGLFIHPIEDKTKSNEVSAEVRMECYKTLRENYFPNDRTMLSIFPAVMRYAGPREAVFHAIIRKNYGCTHFIVDKNYGSVGNFYAPYEAQEIFKEFGSHEMEIKALLFENAYYCKKCMKIVTQKTCPHSFKDHVLLSDAEVKEMLAKGERPPVEFTRPEVADILIEAAK